MWRRALNKWRQYRYRFVPWLAVNLKNRTTRSVSKGEADRIIPDEQVEKLLLSFFEEMYKYASGCRTKSPDSVISLKPSEVYLKHLDIMFQQFGFVTERRTSQLSDGGRGVTVTRGTVNQGCVVSMYPGTIYQVYDPVFLTSLGNPFIFRCLDGQLIDGNDKNLSKIIYRESIGPYQLGDSSWLTEFPVNPLAVGQYVNNQSKRFSANVAYQEFDIPTCFPLHLRQFLPNVHYGRDSEDSLERLTRVVVLVSTRKIEEGEELFSSYFTIVH